MVCSLGKATSRGHFGFEHMYRGQWSINSSSVESNDQTPHGVQGRAEDSGSEARESTAQIPDSSSQRGAGEPGLQLRWSQHYRRIRLAIETGTNRGFVRGRRCDKLAADISPYQRLRLAAKSFWRRRDSSRRRCDCGGGLFYKRSALVLLKIIIYNSSRRPARLHDRLATIAHPTNATVHPTAMGQLALNASPIPS